MSDTFIAVSDIHLGWKLFNIPELSEDIKDIFQRICDIAIEKKVSRLFIVGDLFDHNRPSPDLVEFVQQQIKRLTRAGVLISGILGDHDKSVNGTGWAYLAGITPLSGDPDQQLKYVGLDYCDDSQSLIHQLAERPKAVNKYVEWIFLHGQAVQLFPFCSDKKKLDFKEIDVFACFPNLKGVVLGDIHKPIEEELVDPVRNKKAFIGYCGSPAIIRRDEINTKTGLLHYDGKKLSRIPCFPDRVHRIVELTEDTDVNKEVLAITKEFEKAPTKRPLFVVTYSKGDQPELAKLAPLYDIGLVKLIQLTNKDTEDEEVVNIRSELKTENKIEEALKVCSPSTEVYELTLSLLNDEPKTVLDNFKTTALNESV